MAQGQNLPAEVVVHNSYAYWTNMGSITVPDGSVMKRPVDQSSLAVAIAQNQACPLGIAVYGDYVYWANPCSGQIMKASK